MKKRMNINLSNRWLYSILAFVIVVLTTVLVTSAWDTSKNVYHPGADVKITIDGTNYSLQEALDNDLISGGTDTRCDTSGTCDQVCIGSDCETSWPGSNNLKVSGYIVSESGVFSDALIKCEDGRTSYDETTFSCIQPKVIAPLNPELNNVYISSSSDNARAVCLALHGDFSSKATLSIISGDYADIKVDVGGSEYWGKETTTNILSTVHCSYV